MNSLLTVGIDVGTTSTHLTFSRLILGNTSRANEPTRFAVLRREVVYQSEIHRTPLSGDVIDADKVVELIGAEYARAQVRPDEVATGAVIITGETAKKRNAEEIVEALSQLAGNFVSASAGPNLESVLAARGSGACAASRDGKVICNVDVGGGTTNVAVCKNGEIVSTHWLVVGGRVCESESVAKAAAAVLDSLTDEFMELWFSGGVAEIMLRLRKGETVSDTEYGDSGVLLARAFARELEERNFAYHIPANPIRATVIGAGAHSLQLSGSTVAVKNTVLPIRNLPIIRVVQPSAIRVAMQVHDLDWSRQPVAIFLRDLPRMGYKELKALAASIAQQFRAEDAVSPLVALMQQDMAAALGQLLVAQLPQVDLIVLDGIGTDDGDYIDIGTPMANGQFVPVVIKEFMFAQPDSVEAVGV